jgi:microtubule-associated protein-like 6
MSPFSVPYLFQLSFVGKDNNHLVSVDASTIYVHRCSAPGKWSDPVLVASSQNKSAITEISRPLGGGDASVVSFVTAGEKVIRFWTMEGSKLAVKKGILGKKGKIQEYTCVTHVGKDAVVGTKNGMLYHFSGNDLKNACEAHKNAVNVVSTFQNGQMLLSGGRDGNIHAWDVSRWNESQGMKATRTWSMNSNNVFSAIIADLVKSTPTEGADKQRSLIGPVATSVRSVCMHEDGTRLVVGTQCSQIIELDANVGGDGAKLFGKDHSVIMHGHFSGELWGLAVHPSKHEFCTVGDDKTLRIWDMKTKHLKRWKLLEGPARACCYSNNGTKIAIGMGNDSNNSKKTSKNKSEGQKDKDNEGRVVVYNEGDFSILKDLKTSKRWVSEIKFSPNDRMMAVGTHDSSIYLYDAANGFKPMKPFKKHSSYITHFDFSSDSKVLQSNCGAYELLFSDPNTGGQITSASSVKDTDWATWSCTLGWPVQGIWPVNSDGTDINMVDRSENNTVRLRHRHLRLFPS